MTKSLGNILVVDDNEINRDLLKLKLELSGYSVTDVESGQEALRLLDAPTDVFSESPGFDIVLLDIMMPDMSGIDVLKHIRLSRDLSELPVIMVTAKDASEDVVEALNLGANDYVTKPVDFPVLLARLRAALMLHNLTRQKDEFLSIASHDLKNPLAVIRGMLRLVTMVVPEGEVMTADGIDHIMRAYRQTESMERIITDYLDFRAMEDGQLVLKRQNISMAEVVEKVISTLSQYAATKQIALHAQVPENIPQVMADPARVEQVVMNFISNAIKFSPPKTSVSITVAAEDGVMRVEVSDEGPGIPDAERSRLFQKYARISNSPTGGEKSSGLGLAICRTIIELHGGEVGAKNHTDRSGATFWFTLPLPLD